MKELFVSTNDWDSHRELLYHAINVIPHDHFYEFGIGYGSTPLLEKWYNEVNPLGKEFYSYETNKKWVDKFVTEEYSIGLREGSFVNKNHCLVFADDYMRWRPVTENCIMFIDCAPGELRKDLISKWSKTAKVIIVHDSEDGADYVYNMSGVLSTFKYRFDYKPEGKPHTTAASNYIDVSKWVICD